MATVTNISVLAAIRRILDEAGDPVLEHDREWILDQLHELVAVFETEHPARPALGDVYRSTRPGYANLHHDRFQVIAVQTDDVQEPIVCLRSFQSPTSRTWIAVSLLPWLFEPEQQ